MKKDLSKLYFDFLMAGIVFLCVGIGIFIFPLLLYILVGGTFILVGIFHFSVAAKIKYLINHIDTLMKPAKSKKTK